MRIIIFLFALSLLGFSAPPSIYSIQLPVIGGNEISMSTFRGKKLIITAFSTSHPDGGYLKYLNHLQNTQSNLRVIAVPALDFGGPVSDEALIQLRDSLSLTITISRPGYVQKKRGGNQHRLFRWLTRTDENSHFDRDVEQYDQLYIVSKKGTLYSIFPKGIEEAVLLQTLNQGITE